MLKKVLGIIMGIIDISVVLFAILLIFSEKADADEYIDVILWAGGLAMSAFAFYSIKKTKKQRDSSQKEGEKIGDGDEGQGNDSVVP